MTVAQPQKPHIFDATNRESVPKTEVQPEQPTVVGRTATAALTKGLANVFTSARFSDLTITCKDRTWKAHKLVDCTQSKLFMKACTDGFKEAEESVISLQHDDPEIVDTMLYYIGDGPDALLLHTRLFLLADKYIIASLQTLATEKFNIRANADWATPSFAHALTEIFSATFLVSDAETFQHIVLEAVKLHAKPLVNDPAHTAFRTAALQSLDFLMAYATDLTQQMVPKATLPPHEQMTWYRCPGLG